MNSLSSISVSLLLMFLSFWTVVAKTNSTDLAALEALKRKWQNTPPNWVKDDPCGRKWEGIFCNNSHVTAIRLSGTNLTGSLPEEILSLAELQRLDISNNKGLTGLLPPNMGRLKNLVSLAITGCNFSGPIPESIGSLRQLTDLFLNSNHFSGPIPHSIGNLEKLIWLDLSNNQLAGTLPISNKNTPGMDKLLKAEHFHLGHNKLSGEIPPRLFSSKMALRHLIFNHNQLNGTIPDTLGLVLALEVIRLDKNLLSGSVPRNLNNLRRMRELYLANNNLSGPIANLTGMNLLTYVDMSNNSFRAAIVPQWFAALPHLTTLRMESTGLRGQIPMAFFNLPLLQTVVLKNNKLHGTVDIGSSFSSDLRLIDLRNNNIDGFSFGEYENIVLLDGNPFCRNQEAEGICKTTQPANYSIFVPELYCAPLYCFSDIRREPTCKRPYLGSLGFRSFNFSVLGNLTYYKFLTDSLQPLLTEVGVPVTQICLVSSMLDTNGNLILNISFFPPDGVYFNRTGISTIGNILNVHTFKTPFGPYFFIDLTYQFPGPEIHIAIIIGVTIAGFVLLLLLISTGLYAYRQHRKAHAATKLSNPFASWDQGNIPQLNGIRCFSVEDVKKCTNNFSKDSEIGFGGYGKVYKGRLDTGKLVAVKRAQQGSLQGAPEFKSEIELLSRVHHKNVVNLVGFCYDEGEQILIYEYVPNGSLRAILSGENEACLNWINRLKVALGAARGLAYLHELVDPPVIHRDIKSNNILVDSNLNAKVADFGLCKPFSDAQDYMTMEIKGTMGYMDPEYLMTMQLTEKSDVYSFGVMMLELVTGSLPLMNSKNIVTEVKLSMKTGNVYRLIDPNMGSDDLIGLREFVNLAMGCVQHSGAYRPTMGEVVKEIEEIMEAATRAGYQRPRRRYHYRLQEQWLLQSDSGKEQGFL